MKQDSVVDVASDTESPVPDRSGGTSEELRGNPMHKTTETEKMNYTKKYKVMYHMNCRLQEFRENLVVQFFS